MKKINLSISGCMGRMGQQLIKSAKINKNFKLVSLTENRLINKKIAGLKPSKNSNEVFKKTNVIIDFTIYSAIFVSVYLVYVLIKFNSIFKK